MWSAVKMTSASARIAASSDATEANAVAGSERGPSRATRSG